MTDEQRKLVDHLIEQAEYLRVRETEADIVAEDYRASIACSNLAIALMLREMMERKA